MNKIAETQDKQLPTKAERHKLFGSVTSGPKIKPTIKSEMADLQNLHKDFLFEIDSVGVSNIKYPITVESSLNPLKQTTIGTFTLTSNISRLSKGTNMSRFLEQIELYDKSGFQASFSNLKRFSKDLQGRLEQEKVFIEVSFPWFYERKGPDSNSRGLNHADTTLSVTYLSDSEFKYSASLSVFITTLCPCSKEISDYSAHSQRGRVTMDIEFTNNFSDSEIDWKGALLHAAESNASAMIHPVLKRTDEKIVTEQAYENPRFVEDIVRLTAADLYEMDFVKKFTVTCQNEESIHMHDAIATIKCEK